MSGTWHKGVWSECASAVLFVFAWLLIWALGSVDWEKRPSGPAGNSHYAHRWTGVNAKGPVGVRLNENRATACLYFGFSCDSLMLIVGLYILIGALAEVDYSFVDCPFSLRQS